MSVSYDDIVKVIEGAGTQVRLDSISEDADLVGIGADSLDIMNILLGVQDLSGITIPDEDVERLGTVKAICTYVNDKTS